MPGAAAIFWVDRAKSAHTRCKPDQYTHALPQKTIGCFPYLFLHTPHLRHRTALCADPSHFVSAATVQLMKLSQETGALVQQALYLAQTGFIVSTAGPADDLWRERSCDGSQVSLGCHIVRWQANLVGIFEQRLRISSAPYGESGGCFADLTRTVIPVYGILGGISTGQ